jgi:selenide,water dikinase
VIDDPNVLVGSRTSDDAAIYRLDAKTALVSTVDFFTPIVDDPRDFGRIAAANAFSDVYAMGGRPIFALSNVGFPRDELPLDVLHRILAGACEVAKEAGAPIVGGHSIDDPEPKFGLAVTGVVHPKKMRTNAGGRAGDVLVLTKPLGSGVVTTGIKRGLAKKSEAREVTKVMRTLNRAAAEVLAPACTALTDVTGFGLLGHLKNVCAGSRVGARIDASAVPILPAARRLAAAGVFPGGSHANLAFYGKWVRFGAAVDESTRLLLADAQTNGGLLAAVPRRRLKRVLAELHGRTLAAAPIGELVDGPVRIRVE